MREAGGAALDDGRLSAFGRTVQTGVYPIGVHVDEVRAQAEAPAQPALCVAAAHQPAWASADPQRRPAGLFQGTAPALHRVRAVSGAIIRSTTARWCSCRSRRRRAATSRPIARSVANWKREAGRINGRFAEVDWMPLRYLNRGFARNALMPLYAEAQIGLVTPLRDGMNLVAKEYVAAQDPDRSRRAGAVAVRRRGARTGRGADRQSVRRGGSCRRRWIAGWRCRATNGANATRRCWR